MNVVSPPPNVVKGTKVRVSRFTMAPIGTFSLSGAQI